ncbi:hypothetical protein EQV77_16025 [Halobacillus fulvus]|nr:hypothetical protein EQV77_16025 [Halobacillus fulvus]
MPSKTFSFKKELLKQNFRNVGWVSIVYFVGLLFTLPLQLLMILGEDIIAMDQRHQGLFSHMFTYPLQFIFLFSMPVLMAVFLFRYMQVKGSSDFMHSLPIKRGKLFNYHMLSGVIFLVVPILLISLILLISYVATDASYIYTLGQLGYWTLLFVIVTVLVFAVGVLVGTLTGLSAVQAVLTYIALLLPLGIYGLILFHVSFFVKGVSNWMFLDGVEQYLSPIYDVVSYNAVMNAEEIVLPVEYPVLAAYAVLAGILYFVARWLYQRRKLETTSQALTISALKPVFTFGVTFCFSLFGGMYYGEVQNEYSWIIFGYILGALVGYFLATMLIQKTWRVFSVRRLKGLGAYSVATFILLAILPFLWTGYEQYVPEVSEVERVYVGNSLFVYEDYQARGDLSFIEGEDGIESVRQVHQSLLENTTPLERGGRNFFIAYELTNGETVYRSYLADQQEVSPALAQLAESEEYKQMEYEAYSLSSDDVAIIHIHPRFASSEGARIVGDEDINGFLEAMKQDIRNFSYEEMVQPQGIHSGVSMTGQNVEEHYYTELHYAYENTTRWLKERGLYEKAFTQASSIKKVEIYPWVVDQPSGHAAANQLEQEGLEPLVVSEPEKIDQVLKGKESIDKEEYLAVFHSKDPNYGTEVLSFSAEDAPAFITDHFGGEPDGN